MAWLVVKPYTKHRDWNDVDKFEGRFVTMTYVVDDGSPYDLTHRVEWAQPVATGNLGAPLDPYQEYTAIRNMGTDPVLLYHNTFSNWPNPAFSRVILPGHWIEVVDLDATTQPRLWVDSALYSSPMECEVLQIGYQYWEEQEPEEFCDMWAVGHDIDAGCTFKHYPEGAGIWATIASTITDEDHWLADVAGVAEDDYWAVGFETDQSAPSAGLFAFWNGTIWTEVAAGEEDDPPQYGVWGFATDDYWSVGGLAAANWEIWHWNGISWTQSCVGDQDTRTLMCVHGNIPTHAYAAGLLGIIVEWDGLAWVTHPTGPEMEGWNYYGTWTSGTPNTWVCGGDAGAFPNPWLSPSGGNGCIFTEVMPAIWQSYTLPAGCPTLRAMWGFSDNDIWAVGDAGWILRFDGFNWIRIPEPAELQEAFDYRGVFGCYPYSVWAIGTTKSDDNVIIHWDGANWSVAHGPNIDEFDLYGLKGVEVVP